MADKDNRYTLDQVKSTYSFWGRFSFLYGASGVITFLGSERFLRNRTAARIGLAPGDKVIDVGCGTGRNFPHLARRVGPEGKILGFDYTQEMLDAAQKLCDKNGWENVKLAQGDAAILDIGEDNFDGAISVLAISAIPGWESALRRSREVLRPGGVLAVCDAKLFDGALSFLNPLVELVYRYGAVWDPSKPIPQKMKEIFGNVSVETFNFGTYYISISKKV